MTKHEDVQANRREEALDQESLTQLESPGIVIAEASSVEIVDYVDKLVADASSYPPGKNGLEVMRDVADKLPRSIPKIANDRLVAELTSSDEQVRKNAKKAISSLVVGMVINAIESNLEENSDDNSELFQDAMLQTTEHIEKIGEEIKDKSNIDNERVPNLRYLILTFLENDLQKYLTRKREFNKHITDKYQEDINGRETVELIEDDHGIEAIMKALLAEEANDFQKFEQAKLVEDADLPELSRLLLRKFVLSSKRLTDVQKRVLQMYYNLLSGKDEYFEIVDNHIPIEYEGDDSEKVSYDFDDNEIYAKIQNGEITQAEIAQILNISNGYVSEAIRLGIERLRKRVRTNQNGPESYGDWLDKI